MTERPILFSAPMVRAILDGCKTQTRRLKTNARSGDILWVRETFAYHENKGTDCIVYRADIPDKDWDLYGPWKPAIFLPKTKSRIRLYVERVREERLWSITEWEVLAEGFPLMDWTGGQDWPATAAFAEYWDRLHHSGGGSWGFNPEVYVIEFHQEVTWNG